MNTKLKSLLQQLLQSPRRFPVEFALGVVFFIIAVWDSETSAWNEAAARMEGATISSCSRSRRLPHHGIMSVVKKRPPKLIGNLE